MLNLYLLLIVALTGLLVPALIDHPVNFLHRYVNAPTVLITFGQFPSPFVVENAGAAAVFVAVAVAGADLLPFFYHSFSGFWFIIKGKWEAMLIRSEGLRINHFPFQITQNQKSTDHSNWQYFHNFVCHKYDTNLKILTCSYILKIYFETKN